MKKLFLLMVGLLAMTATAYALDASEIQGKWVSGKISEGVPEQGLTVDQTIELTFNEDGKAHLVQKDNTTMADPNGGVKIYVYTEVSLDCAYTVAGDSISLQPNAETFQMKCSEDDIRIIGIEDAAQVDAIKTGMVQQMGSMLQQAKEQMGSENMVMNNVVIMAKKMKVMMDDKMVTFKKK